MIITIDTTKDSTQDIKRAISLLQQYIGEQHTPYTVSQPDTTQQTQPAVGMNLFDMPLPSQTQQQTTAQPNQQTTASFIFDDPLPSQQTTPTTQMQAPSAASLQERQQAKRVDKFILETY